MDKAIKVGNAEIKLGVECGYVGCDAKKVSSSIILFEKEVRVVAAPGQTCSTPCGYTLYYDDQPLMSAYVFISCAGTLLERLVTLTQVLRTLVSAEEFDTALQSYTEDYSRTHLNVMKILNNLVSDMVRVRTAPADASPSPAPSN